MYCFPNFEPVCCSMSSSKCCFLTCIQVLQEAGKVVWYSHLLKNFPQFVVIYIVKDFSIVNEAEVDTFLKSPCFFYDPTYVGNLISGSSAFSRCSLNIWAFSVHVLLKPSLDNFECYFASITLFKEDSLEICYCFAYQLLRALRSHVVDKTAPVTPRTETPTLHIIYSVTLASY